MLARFIFICCLELNNAFNMMFLEICMKARLALTLQVGNVNKDRTGHRWNIKLNWHPTDTVKIFQDLTCRLCLFWSLNDLLQQCSVQLYNVCNPMNNCLSFLFLAIDYGPEYARRGRCCCSILSEIQHISEHEICEFELF